MTCEARRYNDQMICGRCGLAWDVDDPEPPKCKSVKEVKQEQARAELAKLRRRVRNA